jgi:DNA-binding NtrC family response regulator
VTDDCPPVLAVMKDTLEQFGYEAVGFQSKVEALQNLEELKPDVVITDLNAPQLNGFDFISRVKQIDPSIPVIVVTGMVKANYDAADEMANEVFQLGAFACLGKPPDIAELRHVVDRALHKRHHDQSDNPGLAFAT